jgi:CRP/FNR family transcriptional regulator, cyclic AMP receptor protein
MVSLAPAITTSLSGIPLFASLGDPQRARLLEQHRCVTFPPEQVLVLEQDESQGLILFRRGIAKVRLHDREGEETVLSLLGPGDVCGEMALLHDGRRTADVVTLTECEAVLLRVGPFRELLHNEPLLSLAVARLEVERLRELHRRFTLQGADATTRLLAALADLARRTGLEATATCVIPPLPQRELAVLSGLARETTSRTLSKLRQRGIVVQVEGGGLRIVDSEAMRRRGLL